MTNIYEPPRKKHKIDHYDFCFGGGMNWYDLNTCKLYMIQEYKEACDRGEQPTTIRVTGIDGKTIGEITPSELRELMKDPEPDPRY